MQADAAMPGNILAEIFTVASNDNILALTSACNLACVFCSHRQNPSAVQTYRLPPLPLEQVLAAAAFLSPDRKVLIGESATRFEEGETFTHPEILEILRALRRLLPDTLLAITTNATLLSPAVLAELAALQPLELTVSLNSCTAKGRRLLLGDRKPERALRAVAAFERYGLPFHGSVVALPQLAGTEDLTASLRFLAEHGALTTRLFLPGYTKLAPPEISFPVAHPDETLSHPDETLSHPDETLSHPGEILSHTRDTLSLRERVRVREDFRLADSAAAEDGGITALWHELKILAKELTRELGMPVLPEPSLPVDLTPEIYGIVRGSAAERAGLLANDLILAVNGRQVSSRVEAFKLVCEAAKPILLVRRAVAEFLVTLDKGRKQSSGLVMQFDLDSQRFRAAEAKIRRANSQAPLLLTSRFAERLVRSAVCVFGLPPETTVKAVENNFFGGSIMAAGLLVVADLLTAAEEAMSQKKHDLVLVPQEAFDRRDFDLAGVSLAVLEERLGVPVLTA